MCRQVDSSRNQLVGTPGNCIIPQIQYRQNSRKAVTQSYRAFDMAASCTLYNKSAGDTVDIFIYSVFYMFEDIKKVFDIDKKSMNKE